MPYTGFMLLVHDNDDEPILIEDFETPILVGYSSDVAIHKTVTKLLVFSLEIKKKMPPIQ